MRFVQEIPRHASIDVTSRDISVVTGPRRAGKTFLMLRAVKSLLERGERAVYLSMDDPALRMSHRELAERVRAEFPEGRGYLFLDEVQEWEGWDFRLRWLHDVGDFKLVVSGSSSKLLSSKIPSRLRGRQTSTLLLPLSFGEVAGPVRGDFRSLGRAKGLLKQYLEWGGFPEVWLTRSREKLVNILDTMFYRDVVERRGIRNMGEFREVFDYVLRNYSNPVTWNSLRRVLRGEGVEVDVKTVMSYVEWMRQAYVVFLVHRYTYSERLRALSPRKTYAVDPGITSLYEEGLDMGRKLENTVFLELLRRGYDVSYYFGVEGEVDFVASREGEKRLVEVSLEADASHLEKLDKAAHKLGVRKAEIVTLQQEKEKRPVSVIPAHVWLTQG